jgi:hypothetical protein
MLKRMTMRRFGERWDVAAQAVSIVYPAPPSMMRMHLVLDGDQAILSGGTRNDYGAISV